MKILSYELRDGDLKATLFAESEDLAGAGGAREAVEDCIRRLGKEKEIGEPALPRVTRMEEKNGGIEFDFDAAVRPQIELGQYLNLRVYVPSDAEKDLPILMTAADGMRVSIPETYLSRKTDLLVRDRMQDVAGRSAFIALADSLAILRMAADKLGHTCPEEQLWELAVAVADETSGSGARLRSERDLADTLTAALLPSGATETDAETVFLCLRERAEEKRRRSPEDLASETFACYLRMAGKTEEGLRAELREQAMELVRIDLLIDEVVRRENLGLTQKEFRAALRTIASRFDMPEREVLDWIGEKTLRAQLIRDKARAMIVDSAVTL